MRTRLILLALLASFSAYGLATNEIGLKDLKLQKFKPLPAPKPAGLMLQKGDRVAICGDSITEQKMYSRIMEDYLTMCVPELEVTVRQFGWSGEKAPGFLARMTNDCLRFKPTLATTCYGMNDHEYHAYEDRIGNTYRENSTAIVEAFKAAGARVIQGSPGCVGKAPGWIKGASGTSIEDLNLSLCNLRNIGIEIAQKEKVGFADVFWPMLTAGIEAQNKYEPNYAIAGGDGVHPGWAGHAVMAYAFLKAMGLKGDLGTFTVDLKKGTMKASNGHRVVSGSGGSYEIESSRYPLCECLATPQKTASLPVCSEDDPTMDKSIRSAATLIPFNEELNRLILIGTGAEKKDTYRVTWGTESKTYTGNQLARGINLAADFAPNPFADAFSKVDAAVIAKQAYETRQIKQTFRSAEAKADMESTVAKTEQERTALADAIKGAFVPVTHTLRIERQ